MNKNLNLKCYFNKLFLLIKMILGILLEIPIDMNVIPKVQPYRRIPIPLEERVSKKLQELEQLDIIEKVSGYSEWISPMVIESKDKEDIRLCIDMRQANKAIRREHYPIPTIETLFTRIRGSKLFSKLDLSKAFHQVELLEKSRAITTFITSKGLYRYKRLMFGMNCAPEMFQKLMEVILADLTGVFVFIDDILIFGRNEQIHQNNLSNVLKRLKHFDVLLNHQKCIFGVKEIEFLGFKLSENGLDITESKLKAVKQFRKPKDVSELRSFFGLVNFVGKFVPHLATENASLRKLLKKGVTFVWEKEQQESFEKIKNLLATKETLGFYDPSLPTRLIVDASPVGLGAVLIQLQNGNPRIINFASKSLSDVEKRY